MIELQCNEEAAIEPAARRPVLGGGWGPFRRRSMVRVLVFCGFIVTTVWVIHYAGTPARSPDRCEKRGSPSRSPD